MVEKNMGHVIDTDGLSIEVWLAEEHVFLWYGGSQMGDFALGNPGSNEIEQLANRVATGEAKMLACVGPDEVIDHNDHPGKRASKRSFPGRHTVH